ncbi:hypothetical protein [Henriciella litoralis]|uniref:hypothetical protein n=1 Tax=Henriciella litoralis TaxID=568102 RepID=UPI0009FD6FBB|nr:hypothetical protein [Henriciella litoralis]
MSNIDPDEALTPEEAKRRESIRFILRHRARANKSRANPGTVQKSWAEYSEVSFKPGNDGSFWRVLMVIVLISPLIALPFAFHHMQAPLVIDGFPVWLMILVYIIIGMVMLATFVFALAILQMFWRLIAQKR